MPTVNNTGKGKKTTATMPKPPTPKPPAPKPPTPQPKPAPAPQPVPPTPVPVPEPATGREKVTLTKNDVGVMPAGLIKSNKPVGSVAVSIPSFLQQVQMPETSTRQQTGYVGFASEQSNKWALQQQAGLVDGQPFVYHQNTYIPLDTLEFFLCMGSSFQSMMAGKKGEFIFVTRDMELRMDDVIWKGNVAKLDPHYVCLLLVKMNDSLLPIKGDFRGTKSGGIENAIRAVEAAERADWLKLSDAHKATAAFPQPFGRVFNSINTKRGISKRNGNPYYTAECQPSPATVTQMQLLVSAFKDESFVNTLNEAHANYNSRVQFLDNIITNPPEENTAT